MSLILIVIYCLLAAVCVFGLTFHDELQKERERAKKKPPSLIVIEGGKHHSSGLHRRA
ncbi:MAG: hypothetical protein WA655_05480 [Candidatus Korobacteraceae bacterium]